MSGSELLDEYFLDLKDVQAKTLRFNQSEFVKRKLRKRPKDPKILISKVFVSNRGNKYLVLLSYSEPGNDVRRTRLMSSYHIGLLDTAKGLSAIIFYAESGQAVKYTPHFFSRYRERFMKVCDWQTRNALHSSKNTMDIVGIYMMRNLTMTWIETKSVFRNKIHVFGPVEDGVALLQWDTNHELLQANTFVTMDMLNDNQTQMVKSAKAYLALSEDQRMQYKFPDFLVNKSKNS